VSGKKADRGMVSKVVIPAAGLGTRLLSATKEQPKEMLPLFASDSGTLCLKPTVQQIFEQLFDLGLREFCFVVGKGKRAIEDHFTPDRDYIGKLNAHGKGIQALQLERFYDRIDQSTIVWVNQPQPRGFGHAVLQAEPLIGKETFLVHAGDTYITSKSNPVHERLLQEHFANKTDVTLTVQHVADPRQYGVAQVRESPTGHLEVISVEEKPVQPKTNFAIMPLYVFIDSIFESLRSTKKDQKGEIQLTDAIQRLLESGRKVQAIKLRPDDLRLDIGTPETYWEALELSYRSATSESSSIRT
jgi:UTP--glucose-1-phosphate uridylyltransferase